MMIIDASAIVKLVLDEENSERAKEVYKSELTGQERIITPNLALPEALNTLWKYYILKKELSNTEYAAAVEDVISIFNGLEKPDDIEVAKLASQLAAKHRAPVYDSFYLGTCVLERAPLLTFDEPLRKRAEVAGIVTL